MRIKRTLASFAAAASLAAVGVVGLGAGAAHAASSCSGSTTVHGAGYAVCYIGTYVNWSVNSGSTDERFWLDVYDSCGHHYSLNWNDVTNSYDNNSGFNTACRAGTAYLRPTESSVSWDGPTLIAGA